MARAAARSALAPYATLKAAAIPVPERLRVAPPDIRTADPTVASEIYAGYFSFDGKTITAIGQSPFAVAPPSPAWRRTLAGFSWLRHLRGAGLGLAHDNARALVAEYLAAPRQEAGDPAFEPATIARRLVSFLGHSPILLEGAEAEFYEKFLANLAREARALLRALLSGGVRGVDRLLCAIALTEYSICAGAGAKIQTQAMGLLTKEIERQILRDGGHIGRTPQILLDLLLDMLPLRQVFAARGLHPPEALLRAIDRMIPMLRMMQHGDGALALFHGMGATPQDRLATILAHDDSSGAAPINAPYAGYQRLEGGGGVVIVDAGVPPPVDFSSRAHASCLAFEYSLGLQRVVVNCGSPAGNDAARELARATAAHSTLTIGDRSSCRFAPLDGGADEGCVLAGPSGVHVERRHSKSGDVLELSHDGYARDFGLVHVRELALTLDGARFIGEDRLVAAKTKGREPGPTTFALRFHLHPRVQAALTADGRKVEILLPSGEKLLFSAMGVTPAVEESIFFAAPEGPRRALQIVLSGPAEPGAKVRWVFRRARALGAFSSDADSGSRE